MSDRVSLMWILAAFLGVAGSVMIFFGSAVEGAVFWGFAQGEAILATVTESLELQKKAASK